jgi:transposase
MLTVGPSTRVYLASQPVDLRRGHDGLCALVRSSLHLDPFDDCVFVFLGKRCDRIKCLLWEHGGFAIYYKRLSRGRFRLPRIAPDADRILLDSTELAMLLGGFEVGRVKREPAWRPKRKDDK